MLTRLLSIWKNISFVSDKDLHKISMRQDTYHKALTERLNSEDETGSGVYFSNAGTYIRGAAKRIHKENT